MVSVHGTRYKPTHPAGRNSLKELPGWDPGTAQNCPVLAAQVDLQWGQAMGRQTMASMELQVVIRRMR